jgi:hypothetical protein
MEYAHARSGISQLDDKTEVVANSPAMRMRNLNIESVDAVLWSLVQGTRHLRCFDIRDKIYALLGVATKGHESVEPDYSLPVPSLLNKLLHEIWSDSPPETLEEAAEGCAKVEDVFGVKRGTMFIMQGPSVLRLYALVDGFLWALEGTDASSRVLEHFLF